MLRARPKLKSNIQRGPRKDFPGHRAWVRNHGCVVKDCEERRIEAHHVREGGGKDDHGGTGTKPHDRLCVPLCATHHDEGHFIGWKTFETKYGVDLSKIAAECARLSPHRWRWEQEE